MLTRTVFVLEMACLLGVAGCGARDMPDLDYLGSASSRGGSSGTGGSSGKGGSSGAGGSTGSGGETGSGGSGSGGAAGTGGSTAGGSTGSGGFAGTGGTSGTGGMSGETCQSQLKENVLTTGSDCSACLCAKCMAEIAPILGDAPAMTLYRCGQDNKCTGDCCYCNDNHPCSNTCNNYGGGPCAAETEKAAGFPSPTHCYTEGASLRNACQTTGNSCNKASVLGQCAAAQCSMQCMTPPACQ